MVNIEFPDGCKKEFEAGVTGLEVAQSIGDRLAKDALAIKVNDTTTDLTTPIRTDAKVQILTFKDDEGKAIFWHSASHIMSQAVLRVFKDQNIGLGVGTSIENGFYQDYGMKPINPEDLKKIEAEMKKIVDANLEIKQRNIPKKEALEFYKKDPYKTELVNAIPGKTVNMYSQGEFDNLCKGPHLPSTGMIKAFKLTKISAAYWRGDAKNDSLQRIYGVAFPDKKLLKQYLSLIEEAEKRNHIKIGKQLDLYSFHEEGPGFPFWHNKGTILKNELIKFWREEHQKEGYLEQETPTMLNRTLWEQSGHWKLYKDDMYTTKIDEKDFAIKPMNCPGGMLIYKTKIHSYKELPLRAGELGHVHRHELSGVLNGLFRVRAFSQDDAHIFCTEEQLKDEIVNVLNLVKKMLKTIGFTDYEYSLSVRGEKKKDKYLGDDKGWNAAETALKEALKVINADFVLEEGEAKFYGPSLDVKIKDALGRKWQCSTIQLDFNLADRFDITYEGKDGRKHKPFILHRVVYGSLERFIGVLVEHYSGKFPLWLNPNQVVILPIADRFQEYADKIAQSFRDVGIRVDVDGRTESISRKVRDSELQHYNFILVVGEKEIKNETVTVRTRDNQIEGAVKYKDFAKRVVKEIKSKKI